MFDFFYVVVLVLCFEGYEYCIGEGEWDVQQQVWILEGVDELIVDIFYCVYLYFSSYSMILFVDWC